MLTRRLQLRLDEERYGRLAAEASRRNVPVAVIVREAIDAALPPHAPGRTAAARAILMADPMPMSPEALGVELNELRGRRS